MLQFLMARNKFEQVERERKEKLKIKQLQQQTLRSQKNKDQVKNDNHKSE